ncbi:MAG: hydrogenase maturation nickel metallochaperone HypA [Candidatus Marinimicrobia bacterium]|nr:hydrogenase maturation nickel metallochaperone HypA [Candidatus Neomarinimicrobiota bacterium]
MHELSIAQNIAKIVHQEYLKGNFQSDIQVVHFSAGRMNAIIPESLLLNFNIVKRNYNEMKQAELIIAEKEIIIKCNVCLREYVIQEPVFYCQNCGSSNISILQGKEMYVEDFEL